MKRKHVIILAVITVALGFVVAELLLSPIWREQRSESLPALGMTHELEVDIPDGMIATASSLHKSSLGRPNVRDGTVMTSNGALLRGMISGVYEMLLPDDMKITYEDVALIKDNGMNCVRFHVPLIWPYDDNEDSNRRYLEATDLFVDWADELGLYVWLGPDLTLDEEGHVFYDHINDYWRIIAPRYKDRAHVFYDIVNEMGEPDEGSPQRGNSPLFMAEAYDLIRELAPNTLCVLWSFSHTLDLEETLWCITETERLADTAINWTNEVIGFHSYEATNGYHDEDAWLNYELMGSVIRWFKQNGYPIMNTEVPSIAIGYEGEQELTNYPNPELLKVLEAEQISWTTMLHIAHINEPSIWRGLIERHDVSWTPDYGVWPAVGLINPYKRQSALALPYETNSAYRSMSEASSLTESGNMTLNSIPSIFVNNTHYVKYKSLNFGVLEPLSLTVRVRGFEDDARIIVREDSPDGTIICDITIRRSDGENIYYTEPILSPISGVADIVFTFCGPKEDSDYFAICYFIEWQFNLPPVDSPYLHTDIWNTTTPAARFHYRNNGNIWRAASDDIEAVTDMGRQLKVSGITDGSQLLYSMVPFAVGDAAAVTVRAKPLADGYLEIYANWGFRIWPDTRWTFRLGQCLIDGTTGEWTAFTFTIPADVLNQVNYGGGYSPNAIDLMFRFVAADGVDIETELFEISEFTFTR